MLVTDEPLLLAVVLLVGVAALGGLVGALVQVARLRQQTAAELAELRRELDRLTPPAAVPAEPAQPPVPAAEPRPVRIVAGADEPIQARPVDGRLFADLLLREAVVKAGSWAHGLRYALRPENRNRIRFEVRQEVKRRRKVRRQDTRVALREYQARQRAALHQPPPELEEAG